MFFFITFHSYSKHKSIKIMGIPWSGEVLYGKTTGIDIANRQTIILTENTNDLEWDQSVQCLFFEQAAPFNLTGITAPLSNEETYLGIFNNSGFDISFIHEGTNSQAINRFKLSETSNENIAENEMFTVVYIPEFGRWILANKT